LPGSEEAQKMTETSGRKWLGLLQSYGLAGSLAKMCEALLTNQWASNAAFLTWRASATKPSHLLLELAVSMHRTDATASGLLHTPTAKANQMAPSMKERDAGSWWPTPTTPSGGGERSGDRSGTGNLYFMARSGQLWPTPATRDYKGANSSKHLAKARGHHDQLPNAVKMAGHKNGKLNPTWVEWLMGYRIGWTDLKPSEMPSSRKSSRKSEER
jgi:hypothetical protein